MTGQQLHFSHSLCLNVCAPPAALCVRVTAAEPSAVPSPDSPQAGAGCPGVGDTGRRTVVEVGDGRGLVGFLTTRAHS